MRYHIAVLALCLAVAAYAGTAFAQQPTPDQEESPKVLEPVTEQGYGFGIPSILDIIKQEDIFEDRDATELTPLNGMAFVVQHAVRVGVPADTVVLILLLPVLATIIAFTRNVIGLPSLGMLVPIMFSIALLAIGFNTGIILLGAIVLSSVLARILFKRVRIMQLPKLSLSMLLVSLGVLVALIVGAMADVLEVEQISIVPILLLILLSERIVRLQLQRTTGEMMKIVTTTLGLGIVGFMILSYLPLHHVLLLYPEVIILLIPINILIGRYFGLRLTEYIRFSQLIRYGGK